MPSAPASRDARKGAAKTELLAGFADGALQLVEQRGGRGGDSASLAGGSAAAKRSNRVSIVPARGSATAVRARSRPRRPVAPEQLGVVAAEGSHREPGADVARVAAGAQQQRPHELVARQIGPAQRGRESDDQVAAVSPSAIGKR